jgi:hypothetical protein
MDAAPKLICFCFSRVCQVQRLHDSDNFLALNAVARDEFLANPLRQSSAITAAHHTRQQRNKSLSVWATPASDGIPSA